MILWAILLAGMVVMWLVFSTLAALVFLLAALILPWQRKRPAISRISDSPVSAE